MDDLAQLAENTFFGKPLLIEESHVKLCASLHLPPQFNPDTTGGYPSVLLLHGFGGNRHEHSGLFIRTAAALACDGIVALRIDFRGSGETGGSTREMNIQTQVQDGNAALDYLASLRFINKSKIGLLGFSFGGLTAALVAAERKDGSALVLWAPVFDMTGVIKRVYGGLSIRAIRARGYMQAGLMQLSPEFFDTLEGLDVEEMIRDFAQPVLIVQGVEDLVVPVDTAYQWKRAFRSTPAEIALVENADHAFTHEKWTQSVINTSRDWFIQKLKDSRQDV